MRKLMNKKAPYRKKQMCALGDALDTLLAVHGGHKRQELHALWESWPHVLGQDLAELGVPLGHKDGVLLVGAEDSMALQELSLQSYEILDRVNTFMDCDFFRTVRVSLLQGKNPLSIKESRQPQPAAPLVLPRPSGLGGMLGQLDRNSIFTKYYEAYVHSFSR